MLPIEDTPHSFAPFNLSESYTRVNGGSSVGPGTKTSVHAVLDYDDDFDDYYDDEEQEIPANAHVTPIQGPIFLKNGSVPVVPLYSYPQLNNGTFVQIPVSFDFLRSRTFRPLLDLRE